MPLIKTRPCPWRISKSSNNGSARAEDGNHGEYRSRPDEFTDNGVAFIRAADVDAGRVEIDLNRRMNETLEAMARAIFEDWFVDFFGPTRAKMEGSAPYLAPEIWEPFPDRLDNEGKPEGWANVELGAVVSELRRGISPTYIQDGGVRVLNQKCVRNRQVDTNASRRHDRNKRPVEGREINIGDILINSTGVGTLGRTAQSHWPRARN